jgi:hypothetical protein
LANWRKKVMKIKFKILFSVSAAIALPFLMVAEVAYGAEVLSEDFNLGYLDWSKWEQEGSVSLVDIGGGDYALRLTGSTYQDGIRSHYEIPRGDNLRCTFKLWKDDQQWNWNGVCGPWVNRDVLSGGWPALEQVEAGIMRYDQTYSAVMWGEGITSWNSSTPSLESAFTNAWAGATSKATAVWVRVWLGDETGCLAEWSQDGVNWQPLRLANGVAIDTIGMPAGDLWNGVHVSSSDPVWIFFGGSYGYTYIDDIEVVNDAASYTPSYIITQDMIEPSGHYYQATVPDTLDLAERAELAVEGLTAFLNPAQSYGPYLHAYFNLNPAFMSQLYPNGTDVKSGLHNWGKIGQSLILAREMCGSSEHLDIEEAMLNGMVDYLDAHINISTTPTSRDSGLLGLLDLYRQCGEPAVWNILERWHQADLDTVYYMDDYAYYWDGEPDMNNSYIGVLGYYYHVFIQGKALRTLSDWHMLTDDLPTLELTHKLKNFVVQERFWDPEAAPKAIYASEKAQFMGHHHSYAQALLGLLNYAETTRNPYLMEFVRQGYEYIRSFGMARIGLFGEMCTTGDMTLLAIRLSNTGVGDYWEDVDSYVRNQLTELQITDAAKLQAVVDQMNTNPLTLDPHFETTDQVVQRCVGVYLSDATHPTLIPAEPDRTSDFWQDPLRWNICCTGNCVPALYHVWDNIIRYQDGSAQINLMLNRASPWMDIESHLPYAGKVVIRNKTASHISLRIPKWVDRDSLNCQINQTSVSPLRFIRNHLDINGLGSGDVITITFPLVTRTEQHTLKWREEDFWQESTNPGSNWTNPTPTTYTLTFKGNTLVDISPRSSSPGYPLYQRDHLRDGSTAPLKVVTRFVPSDSDVFAPGECIDRPLGDINNDCRVDLNDVSQLAAEWLFNGTFDPD